MTTVPPKHYPNNIHEHKEDKTATQYTPSWIRIHNPRQQEKYNARPHLNEATSV